MNVVLSLVRRDQRNAQKNPFWTYYIYFFVYSGSVQNLPPCPTINQAFGA